MALPGKSPLLRLQLEGKLKQEEGQTLILVVLAFVALLAMASFTIDVGSWYRTQQAAQAAADAAALAAAQNVPASPDAAVATAQSYTAENLSGATATVTTPYDGNPSYVEVEVSAPAPTYFASIFGISSVTVSARAVATYTPSSGPSAFFANSQSCSTSPYALDISSNNKSLAGGIFSNGSMHIGGNNNSFNAQISYGGPNGCPGSFTGKSTYSGDGPKQYDQLRTWPETFNQALIPCTYSGTTFTIDGSSADGVYCASGTITLSGNGISKKITLIAPTISISGNNNSYRPYYSDLLFFVTGSSFTMGGNGSYYTGTIYVPNGNATVNGNNGERYDAFIEADTIAVGGNNWSWSGTGPPAIAGGGSLIQ